MLVDMMELATSPRSPGLALIRTAFGDAWVRWCGDPAAPPGEYHVEWTIDDDITWGENLRATAACGPGVRSGGLGRVILRGRLELVDDGVAVLDVGGTAILLEPACPLPEEATDAWVELCVEREKAALYPYEI
ncbi:hypothetical protein [Streptomyces sp. NPDC008141]|uniref:hypothetical protein n=1 Tax=Streptomyces sp. NPDC008141 TaxID=3364815 RepID=UPI0036ED780E